MLRLLARDSYACGGDAEGVGGGGSGDGGGGWVGGGVRGALHKPHDACQFGALME